MRYFEACEQNIQTLHRPCNGRILPETYAFLDQNNTTVFNWVFFEPKRNSGERNEFQIRRTFAHRVRSDFRRELLLCPRYECRILDVFHL